MPISDFPGGEPFTPHCKHHFTPNAQYFKEKTKLELLNDFSWFTELLVSRKHTYTNV